MKNPSSDPVNALLSLGYTLVTNEIASLLEGLNYDPYLGYYHGIKYGRKSLALDLVEQFRQPVIDRLVIKISNLNRIKVEEFEENVDNGQLYLKVEAFKRFMSYYEEALKEEVNITQNRKGSFREVFLQQTRILEKTLIDDEEYHPFFY